MMTGTRKDMIRGFWGWSRMAQSNHEQPSLRTLLAREAYLGTVARDEAREMRELLFL